MKFSQLLMVIGILITSNNLYAQSGRFPTNYVPDTELTYQFSEEYFIDTMMESDYSGALGKVKVQLDDWERQEEMIKNYGLSSIPSYRTPSSSEKKPLVEKAILRYADKRLMHKIKTSPKVTPTYLMTRVKK